MDGLIFRILISIILTAISYMAFPLIRLLINREKFEKKQAKKIALWNSIVVGLIFCIATDAVFQGEAAWSAGPAFLYYWINSALLSKKNEVDAVKPMPCESRRNIQNSPSAEASAPIGEQFCRKCGHKLTADSVFCSSCGTKVIADSSAIAYSHERVVSEPRLDNSTKTKSNRVEKILLVVVSIILLVSIAVAVISNAEDKSNTPLTTDDANDITNDASVPTVTWLSDYRFQYYEDESRYVLLFELSDENENAIATSGNVKIRIVTQAGTTVYEKTRVFSQNNFENWIYGGTKEMYVAAVYIEPEDIESGSVADGTLYFTVYGSDYSFEEQSLSVYDLPTKPGGGTTTNTSSQTQPQSGQQSGSNQSGNTGTNAPQYTCLDPSCNNTVSVGGQYCSEHRCANSGCPYSRGYNSQYCLVCSCSSVGCKNSVIAGGIYCSEHTCVVSGCTFEKNFGSSYCFSHKCMNCNNGRAAGSYYCVDHT